MGQLLFGDGGQEGVVLPTVKCRFQSRDLTPSLFGNGKLVDPDFRLQLTFSGHMEQVGAKAVAHVDHCIDSTVCAQPGSDLDQRTGVEDEP